MCISVCVSVCFSVYLCTCVLTLMCVCVQRALRRSLPRSRTSLRDTRNCQVCMCVCVNLAFIFMCVSAYLRVFFRSVGLVCAYVHMRMCVDGVCAFARFTVSHEQLSANFVQVNLQAKDLDQRIKVCFDVLSVSFSYVSWLCNSLLLFCFCLFFSFSFAFPFSCLLLVHLFVVCCWLVALSFRVMVWCAMARCVVFVVLHSKIRTDMLERCVL